MRKLFIILTILLTFTAYAQYQPNIKFDIEYEQYKVKFDSINHVPELVYYYVIQDSLGSYGRSYFEEDPNVVGDLDPSYYNNSGYDRGHIFSSASAKSYDSMQESFWMSNIAPQLPNFNRGIWKSLEVFERESSSPIIYVVSGSLYNKESDYYGCMVVPNYFYKAMYNPNYGMIAFLIPHSNDLKSYWDYTLSVDSLESIINVDLFPQLPIELQEKLESETDFSNWW